MLNQVQEMPLENQILIQAQHGLKVSLLSLRKKLL